MPTVGLSAPNSFEHSVTSGRKKGKEKERKTKGGAARAPAKPKGGEARARAPQGGGARARTLSGWAKSPMSVLDKATCIPHCSCIIGSRYLRRVSELPLNLSPKLPDNRAKSKMRVSPRSNK